MTVTQAISRNASIWIQFIPRVYFSFLVFIKFFYLGQATTSGHSVPAVLARSHDLTHILLVQKNNK